MQSQRHDIYSNVHKALRAWFADTLVKAGNLDWTDDDDVDVVVNDICGLMALCRSHLEKENTYVHPAMESRRPGSSGIISSEHLEHECDIAAIESQALALRALPSTMREHRAKRLYLDLSLFIAHNLVHMHHEETVHNQVLWETHDDDEIRAIEHGIVSSIPPEQAMPLLTRRMLPAMASEERIRMLLGLRTDAPPQVYSAVIGGLLPHLPAKDRLKLEMTLGLDSASQQITCAA